MTPDWTAIRADFLATGASYRSLAKKWDVSISTLKKHAMREKWSETFGRIATVPEGMLEYPAEPVKVEPVPVPEEEPPDEEEPQEPVEPERPAVVLVKPEEYAAELRANRYRKMIEATDAMMDRVINAMDLIEPDNTYALMTLVRSLKEIREMQGLNRTALDIEEQQLRIEKLKREMQQAEESNEISVSIMGMTTEEIAEVLA